jgi:hypothetical protein
MNKIIVFSILILFITSCLWDWQDIIDAKVDLGLIEAPIIENKEDEDGQDDIIENLWDLNPESKIIITQISGTKILELNELKYENFKKGNEVISWITLWNVDKIIVDFSNDDSDFPNDSFQLKKFEAWAKDFKYNANSKFQVLDFWLNIYLITAYYGTKKSELEIRVLISKDKIINNDKLINNYKLIWKESNIVFKELPKWWSLWNVIKLWDNSFTYSDIKWLKINKKVFEKVDCSKDELNDKYLLTYFLENTQNSYYYWNTCRDLIKWKWISFYLIKLEWEEYFYEKHYIDLVNWLYWIYQLEKWIWINKDSISKKNKELREENSTFKKVEIVDNLFKQIIK